MMGLLTLSGLALGAEANCPQRLRIAFPDAPAEPLLKGAGERFETPPGLAVEWLRQSLTELGCLSQAELLRLPSSRIRLELQPQVDQLDLMAGVAEGTPNAAGLVLPEGADLSVARIEFSLYATAEWQSRWDGRQLQLKADERVGVVRGTPSDFIARQLGWPVEPAPTPETALQKQLIGRSAVLLALAPLMDARLRELPSGRLHKLSPPVEQRRIFVGASQLFYQRHPQFVQALWQRMCQKGNALREPLACRLPTQK